MIEKIKNAFAECGVTRWRINEVIEESAELYFVKHTLDTRRIKDTHKYAVTVYKSGEIRGEAAVGNVTVQIISSMNEKEIKAAIADAYYAAGFALNPDFKAPEKVFCDTPVYKKGQLAEAPLAESARKMASAVFAADTNKHAFINSTEIFCHRYFTRILSSDGTDVSFTDAVCKGDYVVQCKEPVDVELVNQFEYDDIETDALTAGVKEYLNFAYDRAVAQSVLKSGKYDVIISGKNLSVILSYYAQKSSADMIYPQYSSWKIGDVVQGDVKGDAVKLSLVATAPFSSDGIEMKDKLIVDGGRMTAIHGSTPFCRYLEIEPTGFYSKMRCETNGSVLFDEMKKTPCIWAVEFSDFQMDAMSGHFGGEIRLAYLFDGDKVIPITGGSVNGNFIESQTDMVFSKEKYKSADYDGPYAVKFKSIPVAGTAE